jgi:DUF438 domain-containing protein
MMRVFAHGKNLIFGFKQTLHGRGAFPRLCHPPRLEIQFKIMKNLRDCKRGDADFGLMIADCGIFVTIQAQIGRQNHFQVKAKSNKLTYTTKVRKKF